MFPSAVQGHMPFVDKYKQEQIKKVIEKTRSRHRSGPDRAHRGGGGVAPRNTHSMPILWQSVYPGQRPKFRSMPTLDDSSISQLPHKDSRDRKSLLSSLKKLFGNKRDSVDGSSASNYTSGAVIAGQSAHLFTSKSAANKKPADSDSDTTSTGSVRSPKRQRMRTISNISSVMETIEEDNEIIASVDQLTDGGSSSTSPTYLTPVPEAGLFYSCGDLSNHTDSSSSHHSSAELICTA